MQLHTEYYNAVLVPGGSYAIDKKVAKTNEDGRVVEEMQREFFTVINTSGTRHRLKTMHVFDSADDVSRNAPFSMEVQLHDHWDPLGGGGSSGDVVTVHPASDPEWMLPCRLGPFEDIARSMWRFHSSEPDPFHPAVFIWSGMKRALPPLAITDMKCPTIILTGALHRAGWDSFQGIVTHTRPLAPGGRAPYDGREAPKQNFVLPLSPQA